MNSWSLKDKVKKLFGIKTESFLWNIDRKPEDSVLEDDCLLSGWFLAFRESAWLEVLFKNQRVCVVEATRTRFDVFNLHSELTQSLFSGFEIKFDKNLLNNIGSNTLKIDLVSKSDRKTIWEWNNLNTEENVSLNEKEELLKRFLLSNYSSNSLFEIKRTHKNNDLIHIAIDNIDSELSIVPFVDQLVEKLNHLPWGLSLGSLFILSNYEHSLQVKDKINKIARNFKSINFISNISEAITASGFLFYVSDLVCIENIDLSHFLKDYLKSEKALAYSPLVYSHSSNNYLPAVGELSRQALILSGKNINFEMSTDTANLCWIAHTEDVRDNCYFDKVNNSLVLKSHKKHFKFHIALTHIVSTHRNTAFINENEVSAVIRNFKWPKLIADTKAKCVYIIVANEQADSDLDRGFGFWFKYYLNKLESLGYTPILIYDDHQQGQKRKIFGKYVAYSILDCINLFEDNKWLKGQVVALSWRGAELGNIISFLSASPLCILRTEDAKETWDNIALDWVTRAKNIEDLKHEYININDERQFQSENVVNNYPLTINSEYLEAFKLVEKSEGIVVICDADGYFANDSTISAVRSILDNSLINYSISYLSFFESNTNQNITTVRSQSELLEEIAKAKILIDLRNFSAPNFLIKEAVFIATSVIAINNQGFEAYSSCRKLNINSLVRDLKEIKSIEQIELENSNLWPSNLFYEKNKTFSKLSNISVILAVTDDIYSLTANIRKILEQITKDDELLIVASEQHETALKWLYNINNSYLNVKVVFSKEAHDSLSAFYLGANSSNPFNELLLIESSQIISENFVTNLKDAILKNPTINAFTTISIGSFNPEDDVNSFKLNVSDTLIYETNAKCLYLKRCAIGRNTLFQSIMISPKNWTNDLIVQVFLNGSPVNYIPNTCTKINHNFESNINLNFKRYVEILNLKATSYKSLLDIYQSQKIELPKPEVNYKLEDELIEIKERLHNISIEVSNTKVIDDAEVVFVLPSVQLGGGTLSVFQHVNEMILRGIKVKVISLTANHQIDFPLLTGIISVTKEQFFNLDWANQKVIATFWATAFYVERLIKFYGKLKGFYYVQDYEPWFYPNTDIAIIKNAKASYHLGLTSVVKTKFLYETLKKEENIEANIVTPGIARNIFFPGMQESYSGPLRITGLYRANNPRRGGTEMLNLIEQLLYRMPNLIVKLFGDPCDLDEFRQLPIEFLGNLNQREVAKLYQNSDILLDLSSLHGFGRMGIEAMACGAIPVLRNSGGVMQYATDRINSIVINHESMEQVTARIIELASNPDLRFAIRKSSILSAQKYSETRATDDWADILQLSTDNNYKSINYLLEPGIVRLVKEESI
jgi:glycosyltransferase involved in cell wall biosynthesis